MLIGHIIKTLKDRLDNNKITIFKERGRSYITTCSFELPIEEKELINFENNSGLYLPEDYRSFLTIHNGAKIFEILLEEENIGGGLELFSLTEIIKYQDYLDYLKEEYSLIPIGIFDQEFIVINLDSVKKKDPNYLSILNKFDGPQALNLNFEIFLDRFIVSQGSAFWVWHTDTASNYFN